MLSLILGERQNYNCNNIADSKHSRESFSTTNVSRIFGQLVNQWRPKPVIWLSVPLNLVLNVPAYGLKSTHTLLMYVHCSENTQHLSYCLKFRTL
jgi:hypothetical protein